MAESRARVQSWLVALLALSIGAQGATKVPFPNGPLAPHYELYYRQSLDHFNPLPHNRWAHRYLVNNQSWDGRGRLMNGCRGPILMYAGNEGSIDSFYPANGFMVNEVAPRLGALLLFPEARFYGKSMPFGNTTLTAQHLKYLTTSQVLEDYIELLAHLKAALPGAADCPVVVFGGSYGGTLAALLRAAYPAAITGALAASSELGYYDVGKWVAHGVTEYTFEDIMVRDYKESRSDCMPAIQKAKRLIDATPEDELVKLFRVCSKKALGPKKHNMFVLALEDLPQQDYPYAIDNMPASPINATCDVLAAAAAHDDNGAALLAAVVTVVGWAQSWDLDHDGSCLPKEGEGMVPIPGDGPAPNSWGWQSCTETMHAFSARELREYTFNASDQALVCRSIYGAAAFPDTEALARRFGAYALADGTSGVSRIIWSHGNLDPWHGWFQNIAEPPASSEVYHFFMQGSAHHLDLRGSRPDADPPMVTAARQREEEIIKGWIHEASGGPGDATFMARGHIIFA